MSYTTLPDAGLAPGFYQQLPAGTTGWQNAPVPGWGINPFRAGPRRIGVGESPIFARAHAVPWNDAVLPRYTPVAAVDVPMNGGTVALAAAAGIMLGMGFAWGWFTRKKG